MLIIVLAYRKTTVTAAAMELEMELLQSCA